MQAERDFEDVDEEKKPRAGSHEREFRQADGQEIKHHERAGGVRHHGRKSGGDARERDEPAGVREPRGEFAGLLSPPELQRDHGEQNSADGSLRGRVVEPVQRKTAEQNAEHHPRK